MIKITRNNKVYEYDRKILWVDKNAHLKLKEISVNRGVSMRELINEYTDKL